MELQEYVRQGQEFLRCGYTTGTCATLATKACGMMLFSHKKLEKVSVLTPADILVEVEVFSVAIEEKKVSCSVYKDGGDDIDVTHGAEISVTVSLCEEEQINIQGGKGVGIVTKKGLDQAVGEFAINSVPRKQIIAELEKIKEEFAYSGGFLVEISVPKGEELAKKTFNPQLGILGGISILGTSGIVRPRSLTALLKSIEVELKMHKEQGVKELILTPGNYGMAFLEQNTWIQGKKTVQVSNFIGDTIDLCGVYGFETLLLVGHIGKLVKVAGGIMNTHSKVADCRVEIFSAYTALCGGTQGLIEKIMDSATSEACLDLLREENLEKQVLEKICETAQKKLEHRVKEGTSVGFLTFSQKHGLLACSQQGQKIIESWEKKE